MDNLTKGSVALSIKQVQHSTFQKVEANSDALFGNTFPKGIEYGLDVGSKSNNNYASCYAIPISTPNQIENKGHNGPHPSHYK